MKRGVDSRAADLSVRRSDLSTRQGIDVRFVGHPLIDLAKPRLSRDAFLKKLNLDPSKPVMALLPGSRTNELARLAPVIAEAVPKIAARVPGVQFVIARAPNLDDGLFEPFGLSGVTLRIADTQTDDVLNACDAVITASGTATVQAALHGKPMVVHLQAVADDLPARHPPCPGRHVCDGEPDRRRSHGGGIDPGRVHCRRRSPMKRCGCSPIRTTAIAWLPRSRRVKAKLGGPGASDRAADAILECRYTLAGWDRERSSSPLLVSSSRRVQPMRRPSSPSASTNWSANLRPWSTAVSRTCDRNGPRIAGSSKASCSIDVIKGMKGGTR